MKPCPRTRVIRRRIAGLLVLALFWTGRLPLSRPAYGETSHDVDSEPLELEVIITGDSPSQALEDYPGEGQEPGPSTVPLRGPVASAPPGERQAAPPAIERPALREPGSLRLHFQNAPLMDVLQYLSEAAGFIILQDAPVSGEVSVISHQPLDPDEAVDLLNAILAEKGYAALRRGRLLRIVDRRAALRQPLPVHTARRPEDIPETSDMATHIIPVRYVHAPRLIENLSPLLAEGAVMSANESSNAIVITDTRAHARRMAEIIGALDASIADIATLRVFPLRYAQAREAATLLQQFFAPETQRGDARTRQQRVIMMRGGREITARMAQPEPSADPRASASRVVAAADERTNALIVSAPEGVMGTIEEIVRQLDTEDIAEVRLFHLEFADTLEVAAQLRELFGEALTVVGDARTNTLMARAPREHMLRVAETVGRLDASDARIQRVFVYPLEHADAENVSTVLKGMFEEGGGTARRATTRQTPSRLTERSERGAAAQGTQPTRTGRR